jgi:uncharacterized protein (DUF1330 family)
MSQGTGHIDPTREQFKAIFGLPLDRPVHMINLLRFREFAAYRDSDPDAGEKVSGREAYRRYGAEAAPHFGKVGGKQLWMGAPELMVIGPQDERWDLAFVAYYPSAQAFIDMLRNPDYQRATRHRTAAVADSRLIRCAGLEAGLGFNPK